MKVQNLVRFCFFIIDAIFYFFVIVIFISV